MIHVNVPIHLTGTAAGVKEGGVLEQHCREIEVQCQVARIPENCKIDITELVIGQSVHVEDISLPEGVTVLTPPDRVVAIVAAKAIAVEPVDNLLRFVRRDRYQ